MVKGTYFKVTHSEAEEMEIVRVIKRHVVGNRTIITTPFSNKNTKQYDMIECVLMATTQKIDTKYQDPNKIFFALPAWEAKAEEIEEKDLLLYVSYPTKTPEFTKFLKGKGGQ